MAEGSPAEGSPAENESYSAAVDSSAPSVPSGSGRSTSNGSSPAGRPVLSPAMSEPSGARVRAPATAGPRSGTASTIGVKASSPSPASLTVSRADPLCPSRTRARVLPAAGIQMSGCAPRSRWGRRQSPDTGHVGSGDCHRAADRNASTASVDLPA
ncbi:hypothetical protein [Streptomyces sp. TE33382]